MNNECSRWMKVEALRSPRCFATLHVISDRMYIIGGAGKSEQNQSLPESVDCIDVWDPVHRVWQEFTKMNIARHSHSASIIRKTVEINLNNTPKEIY